MKRWLFAKLLHRPLPQILISSYSIVLCMVAVDYDNVINVFETGFAGTSFTFF